MTKRAGWILIVGLFGVLIAASIVTGPRPAAAQDDLEVILDRGVARVAVSHSHPNSAKDPETGTWSGAYVDMYRAVFEPIGVDVEFVETAWGAMVGGLQSGAVDVALLVVRPQRALVIDYSDPIYFSPVAVLVRDGAYPESVTWADLDQADFRMALMEGAYAPILAPLLSQAQHEPATDANDALLKFETERVDGVAMHIWPLERYVRSRGRGQVVIPEPAIGMVNAFAIRKGNPDLKRYLNTALIAARAEGSLWAMFAKTGTESFLLD